MAVLPLEVGTRLGDNGRYLVTAVMGQGGFGITYRCQDTRFATTVVVKELALGDLAARDVATQRVQLLPGNEDVFTRVQRRFHQEAQVLARLAGKRCRHIVRVTDVWDQNQTTYYAMDVVEGASSVSDVLVRSNAPQSDAERTRAMRIGLELLDALATAHEEIECHGDLKPDNVLLDQQGSVVLIDFGTARSAEELSRTVRTTMYTPGWAPVELAMRHGVQTAGPWSDLYGWGLLVYGLVLSHPLRAEDGTPWPLDPVTRTMSEDPYANARRDLLAAGLSASWAEAVARCLQVRPEHRPRSVAEVRTLLASSAVAATPVRAAAGASASVATVLDAGSAPSTTHNTAMAPPYPGAGAAPRATDPPAPVASVAQGRTASRARTRLLVVALVLVVAFIAVGVHHFSVPNPSPSLSSAQAANAAQGASAGEAGAALDTPVNASVLAAAGQAQLPPEPPEVEARPPASCNGSQRCGSAEWCPTEGPRFQHVCSPIVLPNLGEPMRFRYVAPTGPAGFGMGANGRARAVPAHQVVLSRGFFVAETEVTHAHWEAVFPSNPSLFKRMEEPRCIEATCPVESVNWYEALLYANELSRRQGLAPCYTVAGCRGAPGTGATCSSVAYVGPSCSGYRLLTDAEWEYAARAGATGLFWWGDSGRSDARDSAMWHRDNAGERPHPVARLQANAWGLHDMLGNVFEWVWDAHVITSDDVPLDPTLYPPLRRNPLGEAYAAERGGRGGGWLSASSRASLADRYSDVPTKQGSALGFRLARSAW